MIIKKFKNGIGDDAAVVDVPKGVQLLATCDIQVEDVHFKRSWMSAEQIGKRAILVSISDIAAMGGTPKHLLISLALPKNTDKAFIDKFFDGVKKACKIYNLLLIGGNLSASKQIVVDVTVLGIAKKSQIVARSGAKPEDLVCVTGTLGDAAAGLRLLNRCHSDEGQNLGQGQAGILKRVQDDKGKIIERFVNPTPRLKEGVLIAKYATAMIDVSDGLVKDLGHICDASGVGVRLFEEKIPVSKSLRSFASAQDDIKKMALYGGEDYELCFTVDSKDVKKVIARVKRETGTHIAVIGEIVGEKKGMVLVRKDGLTQSLIKEGWDHFGSHSGERSDSRI